MRLLYAAIMVVFLLASSVCAQEWGEISPEEWQITPSTEYPDAVVIFDRGQATTEMRGLEFERHTRLRVFTQEGIQAVKSVTIEHFHYDHLGDLKAQIFRDENTRIELDKHAFNTVEQGEKRICRFEFTNLQPGDILEYRYKIDYYTGYDKLGPEVFFLFNQDKSYSAYENQHKLTADVDNLGDGISNMRNLPAWFFDSPVYCLHSEYTAKIGGDFDYLFYPVNMPRDKVEPVMERVKFLTATAYKKHTWLLENIRPYATDTNSAYDSEAERCGVHFNMFSSVGLGQNRVLTGSYHETHWEYVGRNIQGYLNNYVKTTRSMTKAFREVCSPEDSTMEKIEKICTYLRSEFTVDSTGYYLRPTHKNMSQLYKKKRGMPFEINILLVEMLKRAGEEAWPVLISTRNKIPFVKSGQFNHMLAMVEVDGAMVVLDASCRECLKFDLPELCRVDKGVVVDYDNSRIVDIEYE